LMAGSGQFYTLALSNPVDNRCMSARSAVGMRPDAGLRNF